MIVKGHDFPNVTLVGVLAADMSLHVADYHANERTFALLTQAIGRAGRGSKPGYAVIQTYDPEHFAIQTAKAQDYESFYKKEIAYRSMLYYPPVWLLAERIKCTIAEQGQRVHLVGPADAAVSKINDIYHKVIYMKTESYDTLVELKDGLLAYIKSDNKEKNIFSDITIQFDFNPVSGF